MAGKGVAIFLAVVFSTATLSRSATHASVAAQPSTSPAVSPIVAPRTSVTPQLPSPAPGGGGVPPSSDGLPTIPSSLSPPNPDAVGSPTSSLNKSSSVTVRFPGLATFMTSVTLCLVVLLLPEWLVEK